MCAFTAHLDRGVGFCTNAARGQRAHHNTLESLVLFVTLVLVGLNVIFSQLI
jgi:uncharacterized MAPEG superfamily protein